MQECKSGGPETDLSSAEAERQLVHLSAPCEARHSAAVLRPVFVSSAPGWGGCRHPHILVTPGRPGIPRWCFVFMFQGAPDDSALQEGILLGPFSIV